MFPKYLLIIFSLLPFAVFLYLLLIRKTSLFLVSLVTLVFSALEVLFLWKITPFYFFTSFGKGAFVAFDIFLIIFGAIFFLDTTKNAGIIDNVTYFLEHICADYRIQVIFLAWFLENFIEGTAGFGTPSALVAPILVSLGASPLGAVIIALLGNSASVAFGAAGTPSRIGFENIAVSGIAVNTALFNLAGLIVPFFMIWVLARDLKVKDKKSFVLETVPFAIWSGIAFVVPSYFISFLGQEFPSIIGSVIGVILVLITTKLGIFIPKNIIRAPRREANKARISIFKTILPYLILIILLLVGKFTLGQISLPIPFIKHNFNLFNPGLIFILASLPVFLFYKVGQRVALIGKSSILRSIEPFMVIAFMSIVVQLMVTSGNNTSGALSIIDYIADVFKTRLLPIWAPFIGAFGSFITGSATISNLLFGSFIANAAISLGFNVSRILGLELVGASAGNMIALADILSAETVVGMRGEERKVLKGVIVPCLIYIVLAILIWFIAK